MTRDVYTAVLSGVDTPLGKALDVDNCAGTLVNFLYSCPSTSINLPARATVVPGISVNIDIKNINEAIKNDYDCVKQLEDVAMDEVFFLAVTEEERLVAAIYALYLYVLKRR